VLWKVGREFAYQALKCGNVSSGKFLFIVCFAPVFSNGGRYFLANEIWIRNDFWG
jgi:hypothetical protein